MHRMMCKTVWLLVSVVVLLAVPSEAQRGNKRAAASRSFYEVLGVPQDATAKQIKKAFRTLSLKHHPDKNPGDDSAKDRFVELTRAYEVLSNEQERAAYDQLGHAAYVSRGQPPPPGSPFQQQQQGGYGHGYGQQYAHFQHQDPFRVFEQFFRDAGEPHHGGGQQHSWSWSDMFGGSASPPPSPPPPGPLSLPREVELLSSATQLRTFAGDRRRMGLLLVHARGPNAAPYVAVLEQLVASMGPMLRFAAFDCSADKQPLAEFGIKAVPSFQLFTFDPHQKTPREFGAMLSVAEVSEWVLRHAPAQVITTLLPHTSRAFADGPGAKLILFTDKPAAPALYRMLANNLREKASFGMVRSTDAALLAQWHVQKIPSLILIDEAGTMHPYSGAHKYSDLSAFVEPFVRSSRAPAPSSSPASSVKSEELTLSTLQQNCKGEKICVIAVMTTPADAKQAKKMLRDLADRYHKSPLFFGFIPSQALNAWKDASTLVSRLAETKDGSVLLLRLTKRKFFVVDQGFDEARLAGVIDKMLLGDLTWNTLE